jgi:hypothetical protein
MASDPQQPATTPSSAGSRPASAASGRRASWPTWAMRSHRLTPQPAHRHPGRPRRRPRAHRRHRRRASWSSPPGRRRHRRRPPAPPHPGRRRLHHHRRPLQPHRRRHHRLAGRGPPGRRLGRPRAARPRPQRPAGRHRPPRRVRPGLWVRADHGQPGRHRRPPARTRPGRHPHRIALSIIQGLLAALAIVYAIRHAPRAEQRERQPLRLRIRPVLTGRLGRLMVGVSAFEFGNVAATLLILRASELLAPGRDQDRATQLALALYVAYNLAATLASLPAGRLGDRRGAVLVLVLGVVLFGWPMPALPPAPPASSPWPPGSSPPGWPSAVSRRPSMPRSPLWPGGAAGVGVRAAGGGAELRQPGRQRHRRPAVDRRLSEIGL